MLPYRRNKATPRSTAESTTHMSHGRFVSTRCRRGGAGSENGHNVAASPGPRTGRQSRLNPGYRPSSDFVTAARDIEETCITDLSDSSAACYAARVRRVSLRSRATSRRLAPEPKQRTQKQVRAHGSIGDFHLG